MTMTASKRAWLQGRLRRTEEVKKDVRFAVEHLEEGIVLGDYRNDSPEVVTALGGLRTAEMALRDLELFILSTLREVG
jgi:hypothetical protein